MHRALGTLNSSTINEYKIHVHVHVGGCGSVKGRKGDADRERCTTVTQVTDGYYYYYVTPTTASYTQDLILGP